MEPTRHLGLHRPNIEVGGDVKEEEEEEKEKEEEEEEEEEEEVYNIRVILCSWLSMQ